MQKRQNVAQNVFRLTYIQWNAKLYFFHSSDESSLKAFARVLICKVYYVRKK